MYECMFKRERERERESAHVYVWSVWHSQTKFYQAMGMHI